MSDIHRTGLDNLRRVLVDPTCPPIHFQVEKGNDGTRTLVIDLRSRETDRLDYCVFCAFRSQEALADFISAALKKFAVDNVLIRVNPSVIGAPLEQAWGYWRSHHDFTCHILPVDIAGLKWSIEAPLPG